MTEVKPKDEPKTGSSSTGTTATQAVKSTVVQPVKSLADEAAAKAKEMRLKSLREKVHGKDGAKKADAEKDTAAGTDKPAVKQEGKEEDDAGEKKEDEKKPEDIETKLASLDLSATTKDPGLQSPTSGAWKSAPPTALRETLQSPTSGRWASADIVSPAITSLHGSALVSASEEEIAAVEEEETIPEEPEKEAEEEEKS